MEKGEIIDELKSLKYSYDLKASNASEHAQKDPQRAATHNMAFGVLTAISADIERLIAMAEKAE